MTKSLIIAGTLMLLAGTSTFASIHKVKNGENDWIIAHHNGITVSELHRLNPGVNFSALQPGTKLEVSSDDGPSKPSVHHSSSKLESHTGLKRSRSRHYKVTETDDDNRIAKKLGISHRSLLALNPDVHWSRLHPGQVILVPTSSEEGDHKSSHSGSRIKTRHAVVAADNVTLRAAPSTKATKVTEVGAGTLARVLDHQDGWYRLRFPKGTVAWVRGDLLKPVKHFHAVKGSGESDAHYAVRLKRSHRYEVGTMVAVPAETGSKLLDTALAFRGTRYVTGGTSRSGGFDCSGLTSTVYRKNGVAIPRTSREQSQVGLSVDRKHLKKGDLVFFMTNGKRHINHVGIYLGDGKFVHASSGRGYVTVSSLSDGYYRERFAGARRVLKSKKKKSTKA